MNYLEAAKITATVESYLDTLWKSHPKTMQGHGVRLGADGKPEVFVIFTERTEIMGSYNGVRIVSEVRPTAYLAMDGTEHKLEAFQCSDCDDEFVIIMLNKSQKWDSTPACPSCASDGCVAKIDCIDLRLFERTNQFEVVKSLKPLPK